ncbi:hypothetical protein COO60DRAFT_1271791 [Scenedesmus sp. NREL 46B-D3]|nr:hypothetical protein COO60DRAFT_1271791 [Scenedesmus sp. NREL 46B-D3]
MPVLLCQSLTPALQASSALQSKLTCDTPSCRLLLVCQVTVDNESHEDRTIITVDSANRPGTLVEVVQCLTELGLNVKRARISSDGGWFVDEFHVTETAGPLQQVRAVPYSCAERQPTPTNSIHNYAVSRAANMCSTAKRSMSRVQRTGFLQAAPHCYPAGRRVVHDVLQAAVSMVLENHRASCIQSTSTIM